MTLARMAVFIVPAGKYKNSTQWVHESNASWIVSAVEICIYGIEQEV